MAITLPPKVATNSGVFEPGPTMAVGLPAGLAVNDFVCVVFIFYQDQTNPGGVSSSGWTLFTGFPGAGATATCWAFWKFADSGDVAAGSVAFTITDGFVENWVVAAYTGVDTTSPFASGPTVTRLGVDDIFTAAAQTAPSAGSIFVSLASIQQNNGGILAAPPTLINEVMGSSAPFGDLTAIVYDASVGPGSVGPYTGTVASDTTNATVSFILNPGGGGGGGAGISVGPVVYLTA